MKHPMHIKLTYLQLQSTFCIESNCSEEHIDTIEALRSVAVFPFCIDQVKKQFPKFQNCSDDLECVESIMCQEIRQEYCTSEWRVLELNQSEGLIDCSDYGETVPINCSDQFGLANNDSVCQPLCEEFSQYSEAFTAFLRKWFAACSAISLFGGIISLAVSLYKRKKL